MKKTILFFGCILCGLLGVAQNEILGKWNTEDNKSSTAGSPSANALLKRMPVGIIPKKIRTAMIYFQDLVSTSEISMGVKINRSEMLNEICRIALVAFNPF